MPESSPYLELTPASTVDAPKEPCPSTASAPTGACSPLVHQEEGISWVKTPPGAWGPAPTANAQHCETVPRETCQHRHPVLAKLRGTTRVSWNQRLHKAAFVSLQRRLQARQKLHPVTSQKPNNADKRHRCTQRRPTAKKGSPFPKSQQRLATFGGKLSSYEFPPHFDMKLSTHVQFLKLNGISQR